MTQYQPLITTAQAAAILNIPPNTLRVWVFRGKIKQVYPGLFDPAELNHIIAHKRGRPAKEHKK